jgi:hypothetical protein
MIIVSKPFFVEAYGGAWKKSKPSNRMAIAILWNHVDAAASAAAVS